MQSTILPKKNTMPTLIVRYCNDVVAHNGRGIIMQENRKTGSWTISYNTLVRKVIHNCGKCVLDLVRRLWQIFQKTGSVNHPHTAWKVSKYGVFSGPYFPSFGPNTERYGVSLGIHSKCEKKRTRKNSVFGHFSPSVIHLLWCRYLLTLSCRWKTEWIEKIWCVIHMIG